MVSIPLWNSVNEGFPSHQTRLVDRRLCRFWPAVVGPVLFVALDFGVNLRVNRANRSVASLLGLTVLSIPSQPGATVVHAVALEP